MPDDNIGDELQAAFYWASISPSERKKITMGRARTLAEIKAHAPAGQLFDLSTYEAQASKKNFSESLSRHLAVKIANVLRPRFEGILPDQGGQGHESKARTARKYKKLDVNYSTPRLGLALGVSIKTINAKDKKSKRFSKNFTRIDGELRAEAADYHERQPYSVMIALLFLPFDACFDNRGRTPSSFGKAVKDFRSRSNRQGPTDSVMLFEQFFIGLYDTRTETFGNLIIFDVNDPPPKQGLPSRTLTIEQMLYRIVETYDQRNNPPFAWESGEAEDVAETQDPDEEDDEDEA